MSGEVEEGPLRASSFPTERCGRCEPASDSPKVREKKEGIVANNRAGLSLGWVRGKGTTCEEVEAYLTRATACNEKYRRRREQKRKRISLVTMASLAYAGVL